jgi:hypothetical protein
MAKKDKKGFRIPKEIGGVKIPKEARRAGEAILEKANSPEGRQMLASGIAMAATAAAAMAARQARGPAAPAKPAPDPAGPQRPGQSGTVDPHQVADAIGQAANALMNKMFGAR